MLRGVDTTKSPKDFESAWKSIGIYARAHDKIETLEMHVINDIGKATSREVIVASHASKKRRHRTLSKEDFRYAWEMLVARDSIGLDDIDPELRGRRAIILAFLQKVPDVEYSLKPLRLRLKKN